MCRSDVNARRQPLKNLRKHRQERQNPRFQLLPEVRERCKKSKNIDTRAYVNEGSLQGRSRWPKPFQNPSPKHLKFRIPLDFFSYFCPRAPQERPRAPRSGPRAPKGTPRAEKHAKTYPCKNQPEHKKTHQNVSKFSKMMKKTHAKGFDALPRPGWVSNADPSLYVGSTPPCRYSRGARGLKRPELDLKRYDLKRRDFEGILLKFEA